MRLVVLSSRRLLGALNDPIHRGFLDAFPGEVLWVGPGERIPPARDVAAQVDALQPDLVLVNMKKRVAAWLDPETIARMGGTRVMLEVDYCYETSDAWYEAARFDRIFFRAQTDAMGTRLPDAQWLPFSVHESWLCPPQALRARQRPVGFIGTAGPATIYPARARALEHLRRAGLEPMPKGRIRGNAYAHWWRGVEIGLTCSSVFRQENAKHLIIPAAGALLLTDGSPGLPALLPPGSYATYRSDASDVVDVVRGLLDDPRAMQQRRDIALAHVRAHHTHAQRWAELLRTVDAAPAATLATPQRLNTVSARTTLRPSAPPHPPAPALP